MKMFGDFAQAIDALTKEFGNFAHDVHPAKWQGFDVSEMPAAQMKEMLDVSFKLPLHRENLQYYRDTIQPNLPWADDHFQERVDGKPVNPGETWQTWPWANKADESRIFNGGKFSHTYMERYWPTHNPDNEQPMLGHRFHYGDLHDVVNLLHSEPETRQAYLPIFFPEDTGATHGNRVPCTLGYHFIQRFGYLHVYYPIRSCDFYRHFRDDLYLTTRLLLWILNELRKKDDRWDEVKPGFFSMWIGSFHMFINDYNSIYGDQQ